MNWIRLICFFGFLHFVGVSSAQEEMKRTHLGFFVTPQVSLQPQGASQIEGDKFRFCLAVGGDLYYDLGAKMQLKTGLSFLQSKVNYRDYSPQFPDDVHNGEVLPYKSYWSFNLTQYFVGLPIELKLKLGQEESPNHFFISGGCRMQYLLGTTGTVHLVESGNPHEEQDIDSFLFEFNSFWTLLSAGVGYEWKAGKGKLGISPVFDYSLTKIFKTDSSARDNGTVEFIGIRLLYY